MECYPQNGTCSRSDWVLLRPGIRLLVLTHPPGCHILSLLGMNENVFIFVINYFSFSFLLGVDTWVGQMGIVLTTYTASCCQALMALAPIVTARLFSAHVLGRFSGPSTGWGLYDVRAELVNGL